jgi:predicted SAM-dependent methyltransferase
MMNSAESNMLLHLGCGPYVRKTKWLDVDGSWNARLNSFPRFVRRGVRGIYRWTGRAPHEFPEHVQYLNLNKQLPFPANSVAAIYASHVWEHLYLDVARRLTADCFRVLKPNGIIRLVVPDIREMVVQYLADRSPEAVVTLNKRLNYRELTRESSLIQRIHQGLTDLHRHKFMYDPDFLTNMVAAAGFRDVRSRECFDSEIAEIAAVESPGRCSPGEGFAIEGVK